MSNLIYNFDYWCKLYILLSMYCILITIGIIVNTLTVIVLKRIIYKDKKPQYRILLLMLAFCDYGKPFGYIMVAYDMIQVAIVKDINAVATSAVFCSTTIAIGSIADFGFIVFVALISIYRYCYICQKKAYKMLFGTKKVFVLVLLFSWGILAIGVFSYVSSNVCHHPEIRFGLNMKKLPIETVAGEVYFLIYTSLRFVPLCVPIFCFLTWRKIQILRKKITTTQSTHKGELLLVIQIAVIWCCWFLFFLLSNLVYGTNSVVGLASFLLQVFINFVYFLVNMVHPYIYFIFDGAFRKEMCSLFRKQSAPETSITSMYNGK